MKKFIVEKLTFSINGYVPEWNLQTQKDTIAKNLISVTILIWWAPFPIFILNCNQYWVIFCIIIAMGEKPGKFQSKQTGLDRKAPNEVEDVVFMIGNVYR